MGKILGKSVLCFAGLFALGLGIQNMTVQLIHVTNLTRILGIIHVTILQFILWFLLTIAYSCSLYMLFRKEKQRYLIIAVNGIVIIVLFYVLIMVGAGSDIKSITFEIYNSAGLPTIMLALLFKSIQSGDHAQVLVHLAPTRILDILLKSALCLLVFAVLLFGYACLDRLFLYSILWLAVASINTVLPLFSIAFAYSAYRLFLKYKRFMPIILCNAGFLLVLWGFQLIPGIESLFDNGSVMQYYRIILWLFTGNTAIMTIVLAFVFRRVEKDRTAISADQNAPGSPAHSDVQ